VYKKKKLSVNVCISKLRSFHQLMHQCWWEFALKAVLTTFLYFFAVFLLTAQGHLGCTSQFHIHAHLA